MRSAGQERLLLGVKDLDVDPFSTFVQLFQVAELYPELAAALCCFLLPRSLKQKLDARIIGMII